MSEVRPNRNWTLVQYADLAMNTPTPAALRNAVRTVLDTQDYRRHAARMADEFAAIDTRAEIFRIVRQVTSN